MNVADLTVGCFRAHLAVVLDPIEITKRVLAPDRFDGVFPRALVVRLVVDDNRDLFAGKALEITVDIPVGRDFLSVDLMR